MVYPLICEWRTLWEGHSPMGKGLAWVSSRERILELAGAGVGGGPAAASQADTASLGAPGVDPGAMAELTPDFPSPGPASAHTLSQPLFETLCVAPPVWA